VQLFLGLNFRKTSGNRILRYYFLNFFDISSKANLEPRYIANMATVQIEI